MHPCTTASVGVVFFVLLSDYNLCIVFIMAAQQRPQFNMVVNEPDLLWAFSCCLGCNIP